MRADSDIQESDMSGSSCKALNSDIKVKSWCMKSEEVVWSCDLFALSVNCFGKLKLIPQFNVLFLMSDVQGFDCTPTAHWNNALLLLKNDLVKSVLCYITAVWC